MSGAAINVGKFGNIKIAHGISMVYPAVEALALNILGEMQSMAAA
jgi:hypothetical protein